MQEFQEEAEKVNQIVEKKLYFILIYHKTYPTFDILAYQFELARSKACENIHKLTPILAKTFEEIGVKPKRKIDSPDEFKEVFGAASELIIDVSERIYFRSKNYENQKQDFSGKKRVIERKIQLQQTENCTLDILDPQHKEAGMIIGC